MTRTSMVVSLFAALACVAVLPGPAHAQSAIAGVVKDSSGAVLPGVTVEASSDILIERMRSVTTDGQGQYRIVDLRPGVYTLTFTLPGFNTFRRDGLELPAEFTATINAELRVGVLEETVTVSGESPVVDITSTVHTQVLDREQLDALPTGRTIQSVGQLVIGVSLNIPDVGGSRAMQQTYMSTHGMTTANTTVLVDGMMVNGLQGDGAIQNYFNDAMNQEVSYQTSGIGADTSAGGVRLNMIPKEGGNKFSGALFATWKDGKWQGDNFTQSLKDRGLPNPSQIDRIYDFNISEGGRILRDRLWFFGSARAWSVDAPIAGTFNDDGSQGIDDQKIKSAMVRLTWQVSPRNKFSAYFDEIDKYRGHAMVAGDDPETASVVWNSPAYYTAQGKWTSTLSNRLLVEGGYSTNLEYYTNEYQPGLEQPRASAEWFASASRSDLDFVARKTGPSIASLSTQSPARYNIQGSASYVTGSHNVKVGFQRTWGKFTHTRDGNADLAQQYRSFRTGIPFTVPNSVVVYNTPFRSQERLNGDLGLYAQDQWTIKRLTINAGLRWEHVRAQVSEQEAPAGRFVPARRFDAIHDLPNWKDWAPRFGAAYDLFGTGKTALKFSLNRYNLARTTGVADNYNPLATTTATLAWTDLNGDDIAQGPLGCVYRSPGCEINYAGLPANFGTVATARYDQATERTYNVESGVQVQHELLPRISITGSWYRGTFHDLTFRDNQNISLNDWTPVTVFNPIDGTPLTIYNLSLAAKGRQIDNLDTIATKDRSQRYQSFGMQINARLPGAAMLFGGLGFERSLENTCDEPDDPNLLRFCEDANLPGFRIPYRGQFKLAGSVPLPWDIQLSGTFQSNPGYRNRTLTTTRTTGGTAWLLSNTTTYPATCPGCPNGVAPWAPNQVVLPTLNGTPTSSNLTVRLIPYGADVAGNFTDRINQLDLRLTKSFAVGSVSLLPQFEIFNVFNSAAVILQRSPNFGVTTAAARTTYNQPSGILNGRIIGIGIQARW